MQMKRRKKIPTFASSLLIVSSFFQSAANELPSIPYPFDHIAEQNYLHIPPYHDKWCENVCNSQSSCSGVFHNDTLDLRIRTRHSILDGPGQDLFQNKVFGDTIARQNFDTQFILDISNTLDVSPCKVYVKDVLAEEDPLGLSWDVDHVLVSFQLFNTSIDKIKDLTRQSQDKLSLLYQGKVTKESDILYGVVVPSWDFSLKLMYHIDIIGGDQVRNIHNERVLNQGSTRWCEGTEHTEIGDTEHTEIGDISSVDLYCEFEMYFRRDLADALTIGAENIDILSMKAMGADATIVSFRIIPPVSIQTYDTMWVENKAKELRLLVQNPDSLLYKGNITFRIDPTWGVSKESRTRRTDSKQLNRSTRSSSPSQGYDRCKDTNLCSRGWNHYNDSEASSSFTMQTFAGGLHTSIPFFADFENWREGTALLQGISLRKGTGSSAMHQNYKVKPTGAHWSPFDFDSLGPSIPSYNGTINNGLVLNLYKKQMDVQKQISWIQEIKDYLEWIKIEINITSLDATSRSKVDIRKSMSKTYLNLSRLLDVEEEKLGVMTNSQCYLRPCELLFNTSSLEMTGIMNATGTIGTTSDGTEVAIWSFDSIELGAEVQIKLVGQRAMALLSKSSVHIDASIIASPGTLGGFPGGYSTFREKRHRALIVCDPEVPNLGLTASSQMECEGDHPLSRRRSNTISNNVNGPGSPSVRIYSFNVQTTAKIEREIQVLTTDADPGQTLGGGVILHYNGYSTSFLPHDIKALELKRVMEDTLNAAKPNILRYIERRNTTPGIGEVSVSRSQHGTSGGLAWSITFETAIGDIAGADSGPLTVTNLLNGIGAVVDIDTVKNGTTIGGSFALEFMGIRTNPMSHDIAASEMKRYLMSGNPHIINANISRSGTNDKCNDGFCRNGPDQAGGYIWEITIATDVGNVSPFSPMSSLYDSIGPIEDLVLHNNLTGCVATVCPNITSVLSSHTPFSLSFGGGGGSFGGKGGSGFGYLPTIKPYGDKFMVNLYGGSGGALGFAHPHDNHMVGMPTKARGGSGGGAIEIVAQNDIKFGSNSFLSCNGEYGWGSYMSAGGGGSGGSILLAAGGVVQIDGILKAKGGDGGVPSKAESTFVGGGGSGGRIAIYGESISVDSKHNPDFTGGICIDNDRVRSKCHGSEGTLHIERKLELEYSVDNTTGAMGTNSSLRLHSQLKRLYPDKSWLEGPKFSLQDTITPERVSFFVKFDCKDNAPSSGWGTSLFLSGKSSGGYSSAAAFTFGVEMKHGVIRKGGKMNFDNRQHMIVFETRTKLGHWYKVDVHFDWNLMKYSMHLDDYSVVERASFDLTSLHALSFSMAPSNVDTWVDEIFVGNDARLGFRCPALTNGELMPLAGVGARGWKPAEVAKLDISEEMTHHASHLSRRPLYSSHDDKGGLRPFDGSGHIKFRSDIKSQSSESDIVEERPVRPGDLTEIGGSGEYLRMWYGEHHIISENNSLSPGGVVACSTKDMKSWKNEGIMINNLNVTDMVTGSSGPFHIEGPKVLYNERTGKYVMWMMVDNVNRTLGMAGVATSDHYNGPFSFVRSFYPDGNKTRDQTVFIDDEGKAFLIRTSYETIEYVLPSPVMQPIWESVKNEDGSTNFALTYHRAHYEPGYDDFHDIYLQRWRGEDKPWKVLCIDRTTHIGREIPYGAKGDTLCSGPSEYKKVIGQGDPSHADTKGGIRSRFLDPNDPLNNIWKPNSVPGVHAQSWKENYEAGTCGIRSTHDNIQAFDPNLSNYEVKDRSQCSNIVDNPIHPTPPDRLTGKPQVIEKRRTKYIIISELTPDFLDTTGVLSKFEGELEDGADLSYIVNHAKGIFDWDSDGSVRATDASQVHHPYFHTSKDYDNLFRQSFKSYYSLNCVIDGNCPVNFKDQIDDSE